MVASLTGFNHTIVMEDQFSDYSSLSFLDFRRRLLEEYETRRKRNSRFSLRAFARLLKVDPASLQKILVGKRALGAKSITSFGAVLKLSAQDIASYIDFHKQRRRLGSSLAHDQHRLSYKVLDKSASELLSHWHVTTTLQLAGVSFFNFSVETVADALDISKVQAAQIIEDLERGGMLKKNEKGIYKDITGSATTNPTDPNLDASRKKMMTSLIEKSLSSYLSPAKKHSVHYARTLSFDRKLLKQVLEKIRLFSDDIEMLVAKDGHANDLYLIQLGFFPLTTLFNADEV